MPGSNGSEGGRRQLAMLRWRKRLSGLRRRLGFPNHMQKPWFFVGFRI
jgi:hypothetical protein